MSRMTNNDGAWHRTRQQAAAQVKPIAAQVKPVVAQVKPVAAQLKPVAAQVKPLAAQVKPAAMSAGAATKRGVYRARVWTAPRVERTGQVLEDTVAPKVSAALSSAAQWIEPPKPRRRRWAKLVGVTLLTAAASAAAAVVARSVRKPDFMTQQADGTNADQPASATETPPARPTASTEADGNRHVRTP